MGATHFCVNDGTPLERREIEGRLLEACPNCAFVLWRDPKLVTMVIVSGPEGVLLGRRGIEPGYGAWCLPGGFVNDDEHPADSALRECLEEVRASVSISRLVGLYHIRKTAAPSMVAIAYEAALEPGALPEPGEEMLEVRFFPPDELPELAFPSHREAMTDWLRSGEGIPS